ncbi:g2271 [Coccomyxa elongata]
MGYRSGVPGRDTMPIDHLMIKVKDWPRAKAYYTAALKPLGYKPVADWGTGGGFGVAEQLGNIYVKQEEAPARIHFAIAAPSEEAVKEYYKLALENGGTDNGAPGNRAHYGPNGTGCFVIDLDNNNIEVAFRP